ncbi:MAG: sterol carrier protein [Dehalococcoidia bacterium]|nr:sterol carrier protein [Dehalococcoidia bacterium]
MTVFGDANEVYRYIGGIFEQAVADPELGEQLAASGAVLQLHYTDPDSLITVDMPQHKVYMGSKDLPADLKPTVEMFMKADVGHQFWLGKVNISAALSKGEMRAKGPVPKILQLIPVAQQLFPRYEQMMKESGRVT